LFKYQGVVIINTSFSINGKRIGGNGDCFLIAEIGQAHEGSLGVAHAYIDAVSTTGADAVKFQTHIADAESSKYEQFRVSGFPQDSSRYEYWKRMEFTCSQWKELFEHAQEVGLIFLSSPFSIEAAELLEGINIPAWKVGSGEVSNGALMNYIINTGKPILLSTGMSDWKELDEVVNTIELKNNLLSILQCTTSYPCSALDLGLNNIELIKQRYKYPVGFSDHSGNIFSGLSAAALGADIIEVHTVFSKKCFGPDVSSSVTIEELSELANGIKFIREAINNPVNKDNMANTLSCVKELFSRSIFINKDIKTGHILTYGDFSFKKPGNGISQIRSKEFIGKSITRDYYKNELLDERYINMGTY
jgi:N,N'-diacetyllegionaminate synthase